MRVNQQYRFILSLVILALFTAGISPACKFVSGAQDGFIEICTSLGIKKIPMPEGGVPPNKNKHEAVSQCLFCFSAQVDKVVADAVLRAALVSYHAQKSFVVDDFLFLVRGLDLAFDARAPPYLS